MLLRAFMSKIISAFLFVYRSKAINNKDFYSSKKTRKKRFPENRRVITIEFYMMS
jgi:hypothetical protein